MTEIYHNLVSLKKLRCILCRSNLFVLYHKAMMKNIKMSDRFLSRLETFIWMDTLLTCLLIIYQSKFN